MWLAQVFVWGICSIQLPEPASRISPRPRSVDFRWSWEAPKQATFTTKPGLPSQLRPLHSGGPALRPSGSEEKNHKETLIEEMQQEKLSNHWSTAGFLKNQEFGFNICHPPTLQLPPPPLPFLLDTTAIQGITMVLTLPCPPAKSLEKVSLPAWGKQVNAAVIWCGDHAWSRQTSDTKSLWITKKGGWWNIFFHKKEMDPFISTYPFRTCIS